MAIINTEVKLHFANTDKKTTKSSYKMVKSEKRKKSEKKP